MSRARHVTASKHLVDVTQEHARSNSSSHLTGEQKIVTTTSGNNHDSSLLLDNAQRTQAWVNHTLSATTTWHDTVPLRSAMQSDLRISNSRDEYLD